jgi:lipopolysaccharide transport system ATP-binding protein
MHVRLAFSVAAHLDPEILIVDEVLAVGDSVFQKKCLGKMKEISEGGRTVLFVSHNMGAISSLCNRAMLLDKGEVLNLGPVEEVSHHYLTEGISDKRIFEKGVLKCAQVKQIGMNIGLSAQYDFVDGPCTPFLGFVINDSYGNHVCGLNPSNDKVKHNVTPQKSGKIKVILRYPKLVNGMYSVTLWFGDGLICYIYEPDCLNFEVVDMVKQMKDPQSTLYGSAFPECEWVYE